VTTMEHVDDKYVRVTHQVVLRHTKIGDYLIGESNVLEIDDITIELLQKCNGLNTINDIAVWAAEKGGEPVEAAYDDLVGFLDKLAAEKIITYTDSPDFISPIYAYDRPLSVIWEITYACNQNCAYCIARAGSPQPDELTRKEIDAVLKELIEFKVGLINITGGEPLLKKDTVLYIAQRASENGISLELLTNAVLVTPEVAQEISEAGIEYAQVSLDCVHPEVHDEQRGVKGAWEKAVTGIANLKAVGVEVIVSATITSKNIQYIEETKKFLRKIADTIKIVPVLPMGRGEGSQYLLTPDMYFTYLKSKNTENGILTDFIFPREQCSIGTTPVITPTGDVYPCMLTKYEELKLGNVRETTLESIYENSELLHELFSWNIDDIEPCNACWNKYYCGGGCRGTAFAYHGTIYKHDVYQCAARKRFARELLKHGHPATQKALQKLIRLVEPQVKSYG
jgi:radical SAM protein with 4Fe4S-binding SPASM domain